MKRHRLEKVMKIKNEEEHPNGMIYKQRFRYQTEWEVYVSKSSDIRELAEIRGFAYE